MRIIQISYSIGPCRVFYVHFACGLHLVGYDREKKNIYMEIKYMEWESVPINKGK